MGYDWGENAADLLFGISNEVQLERGTLLTMRVDKHRNKLPRKTVDFPSLEVSQRRLNRHWVGMV